MLMVATWFFLFFIFAVLILVGALLFLERSLLGQVLTWCCA